LSLVFEVLKALVKDRGGGWVFAGGGGTCIMLQWPLHCSATDTTAGCPCLVLRCRRQSRREASVAEGGRKGDMTQGHMDKSGGGGAHTWCALLCADRPEPGVTCMADDDFVRVVATGRKNEDEKKF
jgi:hypothetical protein